MYFISILNTQIDKYFTLAVSPHVLGVHKQYTPFILLQNLIVSHWRSFSLLTRLNLPLSYYALFIQNFLSEVRFHFCSQFSFFDDFEPRDSYKKKYRDRQNSSYCNNHTYLSNISGKLVAPITIIPSVWSKL